MRGFLIIIFFFGLIILNFFLLSRHDLLAFKAEPVVLAVDSVASPEPMPERKLFGIKIDSMLVIEKKVRRNQNLAEILSSYNIPAEDIHQISIKSKNIFDVRKIGVNKKYTVIYQPDSLKTARCLVYEPNKVEYVVFDFKDSINVYRGQREIDTVIKTMAGVIKTSLYVDMLDLGADPQLVNELVDVFGWQIDFFRIQKNDVFKIIYEEALVEGEYVGLGKIIGGYFQHFNNDFFAINYDQGKGEDFFDEEGHSLRKAFLRAPIEYTRISSRYSGRRYHPVLKRYKSHLGTDYVAPRGTPIRAVGDGIIETAQYGKYNGNFVKIKHNGTYSTQYLHMVKIARGIRSGKKVSKGQTIGYVGSTGLATGNHVCYRFWKNGRQVDPLRVKIPPSQPIAKENLDDYFLTRDGVIANLNAILIQKPRPQKIVATIESFR